MDDHEAYRLLQELIAIKSVSTNPLFADHMGKASLLIQNILSEYGMTVSLYADTGPQLIVATYKVSETAETLGFYAHYDVQPADDSDHWNTSPFELTLKDGIMYGRGVADDKGHVVDIIAGITRAIKEGSITKNIVLVFEGEEESNGTHIENLLGKVSPDITESVDAWYVMDVGAKSYDEAQIFTGLRGIVTAQIEIQTATDDVHSGVYGNRVYNPAQILTALLAKIKDYKTGIVQIPSFYDDIIYPSRKLYQSLKASSVVSSQRTHALINPQSTGTYPGAPYEIDTAIASKILPSFEINGIQSGYMGPGFKTIIPARALTNISCRTVSGQSSQKVATLLTEYIKNELGEIPHTFTVQTIAEPFFIDSSDQKLGFAKSVLGRFFAKGVFENISGGSIPAAEILLRVFKKPVIVTGFTLPGDNIHAANENMHERMFYRGIGVISHLVSSTLG